MASKLLKFFVKNVVLNICRYLKPFYTYKKINNNFLKLENSLFRMPKLMAIS